MEKGTEEVGIFHSPHHSVRALRRRRKRDGNLPALYVSWL